MENVFKQKKKWQIRCKTTKVEKCSFSLSHAFREKNNVSSIRSRAFFYLSCGEAALMDLILLADLWSTFNEFGQMMHFSLNTKYTNKSDTA